MSHATSLDLGGAATILIEFGAIMLLSVIVKSGLRAWHDRNDQQDDRQIDYFEHRDLRERHRQEWRDALRQYRDEGGRHDR